jgi:hypothetical protein
MKNLDKKTRKSIKAELGRIRKSIVAQQLFFFKNGISITKTDVFHTRESKMSRIQELLPYSLRTRNLSIRY